MIVRSVLELLCIPGKADVSEHPDGDKRKGVIRRESVRCSDRQTTDFSKLGSLAWSYTYTHTMQIDVCVC